MLNLPVSNLPFLKKAYSDIIQSVKDTDQTGKTSSPISQRKTFIFIDGSYLSITEPFHIHVKGPIDEKRLANPTFQDLASIMEFIRIFLLAINNYGK